MGLSTDLISQFVKITKDDKKTNQETTVYGTVVEYDGSKYVRFDGSDLLTPATMTVDAEPGERVSVLLKDHTATVTGNISSPAARNETVTTVSNTVTGMETILADKVSTSELEAQTARIDTLEANDVTVNGTLTAQQAIIETLEADNVTINERLTANEAAIKDLKVESLDADTLHATFANIDFSNITKATMEYFYAQSGLIKDVTVGDETITGTLVGVTITGDLIEGNTVVADKLVIKGEDGLYYKLNTDGMTTEAEQTDYNSLNGTIIKAKSITATKISVSDLVAFDATIGGFTITEDSIYSGVKESVDNTTRGIYLDNDGQVAFGDNQRFVKFYKDTDETYKLAITADNIVFGVSNTDLESALNSASIAASDAAKTATDYLSLSSAGLTVGQSPSSPTAGNTLISADGVTIRKGTAILAEFKANTRTASGISSAVLNSSDSTDSESDGTTHVSGTVTSGESRTNVYISTDGNPVYFNNGVETDKVLINNSSGIIANCNLLLDGSIVDNTGEGILTPTNGYGNTVIGYGRYQDGGGTHVYGHRVKIKTKEGFSASVDGTAALETNNASGNSTFGWHQYKNAAGETNIYGNIVSLVSKEDIRINANGNPIRFDGDIIPYETNTYDIGANTLALRNIYVNGVADGAAHGIRLVASDGTARNAIGMSASGSQVIGNDSYCTCISSKSTTTDSTGYSFKITCGENPDLTLADNDGRLLLFGGTDSTSRYIGSSALYKRTYSSAANVVITDNAILGRSTSSSRRYKTDIVDLDVGTVKGLYDLPVRQFKYNSDCLASDDERYGVDIPGFIAEEVADYLPVACDHIRDEDGNLIPEMWNSKVIVPALLKLIQDLNNRVKVLEGG